MASPTMTMDDEAEVTRLNRRCIYLHRLVGDDVRAPRTKSTRRTSWRVVLRFLVYAFIAMYTIRSRSNVYDLSEVNLGIGKAMRFRWFNRFPEKKYFEDIETTEDVAAWAKTAFINQVMSVDELSRPLSLLAYNRLTPICGVCPHFGTINLSLRRVATTNDFKTSTTERFRPLFPEAWKARTIGADTALTEAEDTVPMVSRKNSSVSWRHTKECNPHCQCIDGQHEGYHGLGGYIAVLTAPSDGSNQMFVHLVDNDRPAVSDPATGICGKIRKSHTVPFQEFLESGFFGRQFGSLTFEFMVYNPNLQVMSDVHATFIGTDTGVITSKEIKADSIKLDIYDGIMRYFEICYLVFTGCYFFEFAYRAYKYHPAFLYDIWSYVNLMSIVMSLTSLALWFMYMPELNDFLTKPHFQQPMKFASIYSLSLGFLRCGSLATLTICLRILKFMGDLISRVRLLTRTINMAAKKIAIYVTYVLVIFLGFTAFAFVKFAPFNGFFTSPGLAFMSCFGLLLGNTDPFLDQEDILAVGFFVSFTVFFYFVSVQMFNAIINYAFNMVSEQMEPEFEQELRERRRNQKQQLAAIRKLALSVRDHTLSLMCRKVPEEAADASQPGDSEGGGGQKKKKGGGSDKDRVQQKAHDKRKMPDSVCRILLFIQFAICYMWFLFLNLNIEQAADIKEAIAGAVQGASIQEFSVPGVVTNITYDQIVSLSHVSAWLYGTLPSIIFNTTSVESTLHAQHSGIQRPGAVCIRSWNCLVTADPYPAEPKTELTGQALAATNVTNETEPAKSDDWPPKQVIASPAWTKRQDRAIVRITQRRAKIEENTGCTDPNTPSEQCFNGGELESNPELGFFAGINGSTFAKVMAKTRLPASPIYPGDQMQTFEEPNPNFYVHIDNNPICKSNVKGWNDNSGIVCMLDADYGTFLQQLRKMEDTDFIKEGTAGLTIDFATYNGNKNILTYTVIHFTLLPSGGIEKHMKVTSMALMDFTYFLDTYPNIVARILPGIMYITLVCKFAFDLHWDLRQESYRKRLNEGSGWFIAAVEFFTLDVFNMLEAISISISFISFVLYILWLIEESNLAQTLQGDLNALLEATLALTGQARLYNRLSAMNCLLIFVRPLKFVRQSVRFAQLYATLWDALSDIVWFVFMFAVTMLGCVMYAHVSFGPSFVGCRSLPNTINYLFNFVRGNFDFRELFAADTVMAAFFYVPYMLVFSLVFLNIFFAIIDRYYTPKESPPLNIKRRLKPVFQRICRCIEWDEDYVMEQDPTEEKKLGPPSRQRKVHDLVQTINHTMTMHDHTSQLKSSKVLPDVCDTDERMGDVLSWSKEEAQNFVIEFHKYLQKKQTVKNDEVFIKSDVMKQIRELAKAVKGEMEESERLMRYATKVHEQMAMRDQETLARYILILELKIRNRMKQRHELEREVRHLRNESDKMRFTPEELQMQSGVLAVPVDRWVKEDKDDGSDSSDDEPDAPPAGVPGEMPNGGGSEASAPKQEGKSMTTALLGLARN